MKLPKISLNLIKFENILGAVGVAKRLFNIQFKKVPFAVNYDITWECNLRCKHCYFFSSAAELEFGGKNTRKELSDQEWINIFRYHRELGISSATITGGEPTLRMNLLHKAVKIFPSVQIVTNGIIKIPYFKVKNQPILWVSLDGNKEMHNNIRGAPIFDKVIKNIQNDKRVYISCTISSQNYNQIENIVEIAYNNGVSGIFFLWYTGYDNDPLLLKGDPSKTAIQKILKVMKEYGDFIIFSKKMLEYYITKEFVPHCCFRKKNRIFSYYPNGELKFCVMGNSPKLCENCGCIVPVAVYALRNFDSETIDKLKKFPF